MKRFLSILLAMTFVIACAPVIPLPVNAAEEATSGVYTYTVTDGEATITDCDESISGNVTIPDTLGGYPVTGIGDSAFSWCRGLTGIIIPNSVTSIGASAFYCCEGLIELIIPNSVVSIGDDAFARCSGLTGVTISESITAIGRAVFSGCSSLTSVTVPDNVTIIDTEAFSSCSSLTGVTLGNGVTRIGDNAFIYCPDLESINIPDGVISIGESAFKSCSSLESIVIPDSVTSLGDSAFYGCGELSSVTIGNGVTSIGDSAFYYCKKLTDITLGDSITSIGNNAFGNCQKLAQITIPDGVTSIGDSAFNNDLFLETITIPNSVTSIGDSAFYGCIRLTDVYYGGTERRWGVMSIGSSNSWLTDATIHYGEDDSGDVEDEESAYDVITIDPSLYPESDHNYGSDSDESKTFTWPGAEKLVITFSTDTNVENGFDMLYLYDKSGTQIAQYTGTEAAGKSVEITGDTFTVKLVSDFVTEEYGYSFSSIVAYMPKSNTCEEYLTWEVVDGEATITGCDKSISGEITIPSALDGYPVTSIGWRAFADCTSLTSVTIPKGVTSIGNVAFVACTSLENVVIGESVTSVGSSAFADCTSLTSIEIPDNVINIGNEAFSRCGSLTGIWVDENNTVYSSDSYGVLFNKDKTTLIVAPGAISGVYEVPDSVTGIDDYAFYYCTDLIDVVIPESVTSIGALVFSFCSNLTGIWVDENNVNYSSDSYGVLFNKDKTTLERAPGTISGKYVIPNSVTSIIPYAFEKCTSLTNIEIPDSVTHIDNTAFIDCNSLKSVIIGENITTISEFAFYNCSSLTDVYYNGTEEQWNAIFIGYGNEYLTGAAIHFKAAVEHQYVANGEEITVSYDTLEDALAAVTGGTIKLLANATVDTVVLKPGVTLDLNGYTLTADLLVAMNGAKVTGDGSLKIAKENLALEQDNGGVIPVWNGVDGYVFTKVTFQQLAQTAGEGAAQYIFLPSFSNADAAALLADGGEDNGLKVKVGLTWTDGQCQQFYTYEDAFVEQVFASNGGLAFSLTVTGISGIADMIASAMIVTDSYAQATATGTALAAG